MVKKLSKSLRKLIIKKDKNDFNTESPVIQINSEPIVCNTGAIESSETPISSTSINQYLIQSNLSQTDSNSSDTSSSTTSLPSNYVHKVITNESKGDKKSSKNQLKEEGVNSIAELIVYLHSDKQLVKNKLQTDRKEIHLLQTHEDAVDLDKFFTEKKSKVKDKLWRTPYFWTKRTDKKIVDPSVNGLHLVNRFGKEVDDGCNVSLNLASKGRGFGNVFQRTLEWNDIIDEADQVLRGFEDLKKSNTRSARRGSLLQPRFIFLSPHPEVTYERVLQSANCLPLRSWTSELFLESKESSQLLDSETKRHLKWNLSVEDFRHLLSPELSHFGNDVYSLMIQARRRQSLCPPKLDTQPIPFRRNSFRGGGELWTPMDKSKHKKKDYEHKMKVLSRQSSTTSLHLSSPDSLPMTQTSNFLIVPNSNDSSSFKKNYTQSEPKISSKSMPKQQTINFTSLEDYCPQIVANELTLISKNLFLALKSSEIITILIRPNSINLDNCCNISALLGFQKRIIQLISSYILQELDVIICAKRIAYFIEVAKELKTLQNWHSMNSIILGLQSPPIARLRQSWQLVSNDFSDAYCEFIEISEQINKDVGLLDYTGPSIPLFNDFMDDLKDRCGAKYLEIKTHRLRSHWSQKETLALWVDKQIVDLISVVNEKKEIQKKVDNIRKTSNDNHSKSSIMKKLKNFKTKNSVNSSEYSDSLSNCGSDSRTDSVTSINSERLRLKMLAQNHTMPSYKNIWSVADVHKLRELDEKVILEEIARGLVCYQRNANLYYLNDSNRKVRDFLLMHSYDELDNCLKKSYSIEKPKQSSKY